VRAAKKRANVAEKKRAEVEEEKRKESERADSAETRLHTESEQAKKAVKERMKEAAAWKTDRAQMEQIIREQRNLIEHLRGVTALEAQKLKKERKEFEAHTSTAGAEVIR
jgi:hypothetical protein